MFTKSDIISSMQFSFLVGKTINSTGSPREEITYQYAGTSQPVDFAGAGGGTKTGWTNFTSTEETKFEEALAHIETFLNVEFVEVTGDSDPDMNVGKVDMSGGTAGLGGLSISYSGNTVSRVDSFVVFKNTIDLTDQIDLILHELGHSLGLKHTFNTPTVPSGTDSNKYSVMSYISNPDNGLDNDGMGFFDVVALQDNWGVAGYNRGNTSYTGSRNSTVDTVWDTHGVDHFDASSKTNDVVLDLREGHYSIFNTIEDVVIAYGTKIENATGGDGADEIYGNRFANNLVGGKGKDVIFGNSGDDTLLGGAARDKLYGGGNNDIIKGGNGSDRLVGGKGNDTLQGGYGRDALDGGKGNDSLKGGVGADSFTFKNNFGSDTILDFEDDIDVIKIKLAGINTVADALSRAANVGGDVVFDFDGGTVITVLNMTKADITDDISII